MLNLKIVISLQLKVIKQQQGPKKGMQLLYKFIILLGVQCWVRLILQWQLFQDIALLLPRPCKANIC